MFVAGAHSLTAHFGSFRFPSLFRSHRHLLPSLRIRRLYKSNSFAIFRVLYAFSSTDSILGAFFSLSPASFSITIPNLHFYLRFSLRHRIRLGKRKSEKTYINMQKQTVGPAQRSAFAAPKIHDKRQAAWALTEIQSTITLCFNFNFH